VRASRLVALLLELQHRGGATAPELADVLEVSVRTVYRDVAALQGAGVPLWTEPGRNGGIRLVEGWRTDLDGLTGDEAMALALAGAPGAADALGLGAVLAAAETKVRAVLPPELRTRSERVRQRFHLDAPGWFHRPDDVDHLAPVAEAVWAAHRLDLTYGRDPRSADVVRRRVDPLGVVLKAGTWYLVARHRSSVRTYRVGRIRRVRVLDEVFDRPDDFDLSAFWAASMGEFERSLLRFTCRLRLSPEAAAGLGHTVDPVAAAAALAGASDADADGWREVELSTESEDVAVAQLTALGAGVQVLDPPRLRARLAEVGRAMARLNASPSTASPRIVS
jgi:predicted DNA-binding transcriptional regulator YafY